MNQYPFKRITKLTLYWFLDNTKNTGPNPNLLGDCSGLWGDCTNLWGNCSGLRGNCSGLSGNCSGLRGDCSKIPTTARPCDLAQWVEP
jgi:hypothetical protein